MGLLDSRLGYSSEDNDIKEKPVNIPSYNVGPVPKAPKKDKKEEKFEEKYEEKYEEPVPEQDIEDDPDDILASLGVKKRPKAKEEPVRHEVPESDELTEEALELYTLREARKTTEKVKKSRRKKRITYTALLLACAYMIFLIYGVFCTDYTYDENGKIKPVVLTVKQIRERNNFDKLKVQYENARVLYEKVLLLDYRLSQGVEDPMTLAPEYEALLDDVNNLTIQIDAMDVDTRYETVKALLLNFVKTDTAVYLQKVSSGISGNNAEDANTAIQYRAIMYDDFSVITQNIVTIGDTVEGSNMTNIKNWSPDKFLEETVE